VDVLDLSVAVDGSDARAPEKAGLAAVASCVGAARCQRNAEDAGAK